MKLKRLPAMILLASLISLSGWQIAAHCQSPSDAEIQKQIELVNKLSDKGPQPQLADAVHDLGAKYFARNELNKAKDYLRQSLQVEEKLNRPTTLMATHLEVAKILLKLSQFDEAKTEYDAVLVLAQRHSTPAELAGLYNNVGFALMGGRKYGEAQTYFTKAVDLADKAKAEEIKASALINLSQLNRFKDDYPHAIASAREACEILGRLEADEYGSALLALGSLLEDTGKTQEALETYQKMQKFFAEPPDNSWLALAETRQGDCCYNQQDLGAARKHYESALQYADTDKSVNALLGATIGLGVIEADSSNSERAEELHRKAYQIAKDHHLTNRQIEALIQIQNDVLLHGNPEKALNELRRVETESIEGNVSEVQRGELAVATGHCYRELGQFQAAERYYRDALRHFEYAHDTARTALVYGALAVLYLDSNNMAQFDAMYDLAKTLYSHVDDQREQTKLEFNFAQSRIVQKKYAEAIESYKSALSHARALKDRTTESAILRGMGLAYLLSNKPEDALSSYEQAAKLLSNGSLESKWDCSLGLGKAYKLLKNYPMAEKYLRQSVDLVEAERSHLSRDTFKTYNLDLRRDCFEELVDLLAAANRPYEALEMAERGKARAFLDMLGNRANRQLDLSMGDHSSEVEQLVASAEHGSRAVNILPKSEAAVEETAISPINVRPPSIDEMREIVKKRNSLCVEYYRAKDKLYTWVIRPDGTITMPPIKDVPAKELYDLVADGYRLVTTVPKTPADLRIMGIKRQQNLQKLYKILIEPVEGYLPKNKDEIITIIPHGILFNVPFAALMNSGGDYLVEKHTMSFAPALGVLRATQKAEAAVASESHRLLALGNPITDKNKFLGSLPYAEKEVKTIAQLFGADRSTVKTGAAATREAFIAALPGAAEVHLATHGLVDEEHPMRSAVILAPHGDDDGLLKVRDIITMKDLKAKLIVLSACQTGRGKITGDGVVGLSRAFIIAGTPSILVSQWNVDDVITEFQMTRFYKAYLSGKDKARSLRDSQLATIALLENNATSHSDPTFVRANPRLWAAFQLIGENN